MTKQVSPICLTIEQVAELLSLSRQKIYDMIAREGLPTVHFDKSVRVRRASLEQWLEAREQAQRS